MILQINSKAKGIFQTQFKSDMIKVWKVKKKIPHYFNFIFCIIFNFSTKP